jgi:rubredoxin
MEYRRLGKSGLQVGVLSFGSWVSFSKQINDKVADELMGIAFDNGINFFDNADDVARLNIFISRLNLQMVGIAVGALFLYWLIKKNPNDPSKMIQTTNEYLKYLPIDGTTKSMLSPILDFTAKHTYAGDAMYSRDQPVLQMPTGTQQYAERRILTSGAVVGGKTKRSVSETKKKFVAARQNWKCKQCGDQLKATFEVDHVIRLEHGGSNHVDNLVALCRDCHGDKTMVENL